MSDDLICLSSDEEIEPHVKKRRFDKTNKNATNSNKIIDAKKELNNSIICLDSDEDEDSEDVIIVNKDNLKSNGTSNCDSESTVNKESLHNNSNPNSVENIDLESGTVSKENSKPDNTIDNSANKESLVNNGTKEASPNDSVINSIEIESPKASSPTLNLVEELTNSNENDPEGLEVSSSEDNNSSDTEYYEEEELGSHKTQNGESIEQSTSSKSRENELLANTEDLPKEAITYLSTCIKMLKQTSAEPIYKKFPVIIKMFRSLSEEFARTHYLHKFLTKQTKIAKESVSCCIVSFREVYQHLKDSINSKSIELPKKHWKHVRKLEKVMELLTAKLKELEETEIDFDEDEEDTAYIKLDKYSRRLDSVYKKYCEILKKNPHAGRITFERLDFVSSNFNEINQAISKKYKNNMKFPSYEELSDLIKKVVEEEKIPLSAIDLKHECERCFKQLGDLLQTRRKKELYEAHQKYMIEEDPAKDNEELAKKLRISLKEGKVRIEQVCEEFVKKQELGLTGGEEDLSGSENREEEQSGDTE